MHVSVYIFMLILSFISLLGFIWKKIPIPYSYLHVYRLLNKAKDTPLLAATTIYKQEITNHIITSYSFVSSCCWINIDGLVKDRGDSIAKALELQQSCISPSVN